MQEGGDATKVIHQAAKGLGANHLTR